MPPSLAAPSGLVWQAKLEPTPLEQSKLCRISRYPTGEPFFGKHGGNRFDDPDHEFGTCYFGLALMGAFAETVLHNHTGADGFDLDADELERWVHEFEGERLNLADLTGHTLKRLGAHGELSTITPYELPQRWSAEIHANTGRFDGFFYVSKHCNSELAVVLFERAQKKLKSVKCHPLLDHPEFDAVIAKFGIWYGPGVPRTDYSLY